MAQPIAQALPANVGIAAQVAGGDLPRRLTRLVIGLALYGASIALMVEGGVGAAPWDVFHTGAARQLSLGLGPVIVLTSAGVLMAWIPLRQMVGVGTVLNAALVGPFAGLAVALVPGPRSLLLQLGFAVGGTVLCAFATALYVGAQLGPGPRDGLMTGLARRTGSSIRLVRTGLELSVLVGGVLLGGRIGVGTLVFALGVGPATQAFLPHLSVPLRHTTSEPEDHPNHKEQT